MIGCACAATLPWAAEQHAPVVVDGRTDSRRFDWISSPGPRAGRQPGEVSTGSRIFFSGTSAKSISPTGPAIRFGHEQGAQIPNFTAGTKRTFRMFYSNVRGETVSWVQKSFCTQAGEKRVSAGSWHSDPDLKGKFVAGSTLIHQSMLDWPRAERSALWRAR